MVGVKSLWFPAVCLTVIPGIYLALLEWSEDNQLEMTGINNETLSVTVSQYAILSDKAAKVMTTCLWDGQKHLLFDINS